MTWIRDLCFYYYHIVFVWLRFVTFLKKLSYKTWLFNSTGQSPWEKWLYGLYCIYNDCRSVLSIFPGYDHKCLGVINARQSSCVASRSAVGVYCHHWALTARVWRLARAPALIPLSGRLRTAVLEARETELCQLHRGLSVSTSVGYTFKSGKIRHGHVDNRQHRVKTGTYPTIYWTTDSNRWLDIAFGGGASVAWVLTRHSIRQDDVSCWNSVYPPR